MIDAISAALSSQPRECGEVELIAEENADNVRLLDFIADKIGLPPNEELSQENFAKWLALRSPVENDTPTEDEQIVDHINYLRGGEGDSVTILCDNPDFNGRPNCAIECNGEWTDWHDQRYEGDTILIALGHAKIACQQWRIKPTRLPAYADPNFKYDEVTGSYVRIKDDKSFSPAEKAEAGQ